MRILAATVALFFLLTGVFGQTAHKDLTIAHLTGDFYVFTTYTVYKGTPFPANGMYMITSDGVVLADTPWDTTQFQPLLDSIKIRHNKNVVMCIATHSHEDRTAGLEFLKQRGIKTYTTRQTDEISKVRHQKRAAFLIDKDTTFTVGNHSFQTFYAGPGHTPDNIVIWFNGDRILYGGCLIKSVEATDLGNLADANVPVWDATIEAIQRKFKNPAYIIPGHQAWTSLEALNHTKALVRQYKQKK